MMTDAEETQTDADLQHQADMSAQDMDRDALLAEIERLTALVEGRFKDVRLIEFSKGELVLKGTLFEHIAEFMAQMLQMGRDDGTAANYTESILHHPELGRLTLTLQRQSGQTPHELRRQAEAERDQAKAEVQAACARIEGLEMDFIRQAVDIAETAAPHSREAIRDLTAAEIFRNLGSIERARMAHAIADRLRLLGTAPRLTASEWVDRVMAERGLSREAAEMEFCKTLAAGLVPDADLMLDPPSPQVPTDWQAERKALIAALHDAISRPKGVVPDSATPWYDYRLADLAEARRPRSNL